MSIRRKNHYVPQMYLKAWAKNNKVCVYELLVSHQNVPIWVCKSIGSTASLDNLYVRVSEENEIDDIESEFERKIETPASASLQKAIAGQTLIEQDWFRIVDFAAAQYIRTPAFYVNHSDMLKNVVENSLEEVGKEISTWKSIPKRNSDEKTVEELIPISITKTNEKPDDTHTIVRIESIAGKSIWFYMMRHFLGEGSQYRRIMRAFHWSIVSIADEVILPTTDNPFVMFNPYMSETYKPGILDENNQFIFPLSPGKALIGRVKKKLAPKIKATMKQSLDIKSKVIDGAFRYIYSSEKDNMIPKNRPRLVNEHEYKRIAAELDRWYDLYNEAEVPMLQRKGIQ